MSSLFDYMAFCSHAVTHTIVVILGTFYFYFHVKRKYVTLVELTHLARTVETFRISF